MSVATTAARRRPAVRRRITAGKVASRTAFYLLIAAFVVGSLFPFYWIVITSLKTPAELTNGTTNLLPGHITFGSYSADLTQTSTTGLNFGRALLNSALVALSTTAIILWNLACHGYPCLPWRASMIANDHLAGPGSKQQRGGGRCMETAGMSTVRGRQIKINHMSPRDQALSAPQLDST